MIEVVKVIMIFVEVCKEFCGVYVCDDVLDSVEFLNGWNDVEWFKYMLFLLVDNLISYKLVNM